MKKTKNLPNLLVTQESINSFVSSVSNTDRIGVDTEFIRTKTFFPKLCLLQISSEQHSTCIDLLKKNDLTLIWKEIFNPSKLKILHSARQDLEIFYLINKKIPPNIFDTQIAASLLGYSSQVGIKQLLEQELNIEINKTETRSDWSKRPLDAKQIQYAIEDVKHLVSLHSVLRKKLIDEGRYDWVLEDSSKIMSNPEDFFNPNQSWKRISGIKNLSPKNQNLAVKLAIWREKKAMEIDLPRQWTLNDQALIKIAKTKPNSLNQLNKLGIETRNLEVIHHEQILKIVRQELNGAEKSKTLVQKKRKLHPDPNLLKDFSKCINAKALELNIPSDVLASKKDCLSLLQNTNNSRLLNGWRKKVIGEKLVKLLNNY